MRHEPGGWWNDLGRAARRLSAGLWGGIITGALVGGVGGRLAMFALRLTSDPELRGRMTDDGFRIGSFTGDTFFLILLSAAAGAVAGLLYLALRPWLPSRARPWLSVVFGASVAGALIIHPGGIDFTLLEPRWLAVAMFVVLPALAGFMLSALVERLLEWAEAPRGMALTYLPLIGVALLSVAGPVLLLALLTLWALGRRFPLGRAWRSPAVTWTGRTLFAAAILRAGVALMQDAVAIL